MKGLVTKRDKRQSEKLTYPREKVDDRQANATPLPFICKMIYISYYFRLDLVFLYKTRYATCMMVLCFLVTQFFSLWRLPRFVTKPFK